MGLFGAGSPPCPAGSICSGQSKTPVGRTYRQVRQNLRGGGSRVVTQAVNTGTDIYHASATKLNPDGSATTDVYIIKDGSWQKAATSNDGGKTYTFDDDVAGAGLQKELSDPQGAIHKNIDANINKAADKAGLPPTEKTKLLDSNKNAAENDNDGESESSDSRPIAPTITQKNTGTRNQFDKNLIFPLDLGKSNMDVIRFDMLEFKPRTLTKPENQGALPGLSRRRNFNEVADRNSIGRVTLPIPAGIQDQNQAGWGDGRMTPIQAAGINIAMTAFNDSLGAAGRSAAETLKGMGNDIKDLKDGVKGYFAAAAVGLSLDQVLARTQGQVVNPNLELLFNGPTLRPFNFTFTMSARSKLKSEAIVKIIRFFKQGMAPQRTDSNLFVKAPHTFQLQYLHRGQNEHNFLNKFKECALIGMRVNYTPENNYATFEDGAMVSYEMQMQFKELDPVYNGDYPDDNDASIGF